MPAREMQITFQTVRGDGFQDILVTEVRSLAPDDATGELLDFRVTPLEPQDD